MILNNGYRLRIGEQQMIKAVYFDLDDTLYDQLKPFQLAVENTTSLKVNKDSFHIEDLYRRIRLHSDNLWEQHVQGQLPLKELRIQRATAAFAELGHQVSAETAHELQQHYELEQSRLTLREGAATLLEQLKTAGIAIGLITNGPVEHQQKKIKALGLLSYIDERYVYISDGIGIAKPDSNVFRHVQRLAEYLPEEMAYVGDAWHNDIAPSYDAGWTPVWLNPRKQQPDEKKGYVKYLECQSIHEVYSLLY
jgi:HAD superfamily hydrolase (TIGR01549 family)